VARWFRVVGIFLLVPIVLPQLAVVGEVVTALPLKTASEGGKEKSSDGNTDVILILEVTVNGHPIGKIGEFTLSNGKLMARSEELRNLGFQVPPTFALGADGMITLSDLPGLTWSIDQRNQVLHIVTSDLSLLPMRRLSNGKEEQVGARVIESGTGVTLNYDIAGTLASGQNGADASLDLRSFSPWGVVSSNWLAYVGATSGSSGKNTAIRLDSVYTFADVKTLHRYSLGDFITGVLSWNRSVHMEGVQIRSDFSMRPDLVTFPLPSLTGSVAVPSSVDVLADGNLILSQQVDAGPFEIPQLPVVSGAGTISMTVTNAMGQQVLVTQPFYASTALLTPGLQTFAAQVGLVRRNWGAASYDYGKVAGTGFYRRGITPKFTVEGSAEGTPGMFMAGIGSTALAGNLGALNFSMAASTASGHIGEQFSFGAQRIGRAFSLGASAIIANRKYRDVASMNGSWLPRKQISVFSSISLKRFGSAGAAYAGVDEDAAPVQIQSSSASSEHTHVISANYSLQFHHISFYVSKYANIATTDGSSGLQAGFTIPIGRRSSVNLSATSDGNGQIQAQKSAAQIGQWGYQAYVSTGNSNHEFGQVLYKSPVGLLSAGVDDSAGQTTLRLESQGALSFVDQGLFPSNTIYDSFAIVDTAPMPHVHVLQENRAVGSTNNRGRLLVPDMRAFDVNHLAIDPIDIPSDAMFEEIARVVRPQDLSGVVVRFPIQFSHGALLQLVDQNGVPIPLGSTATLRATNSIVSIGYDGDAYIEGLNPHNEVTVERVDGKHCTVVFDYHPLPGDIPSIGPLRCLVK
jgi:outer membrane usher protein